MKRTIIIFQFLIFLTISNNAQIPVSVDLQNNSTITINGSSNILSFKLTQTGIKLLKKNFVILATQNQNKIILSQNTHPIMVSSFTSNNKMALRDFLKLVRSDIYPSFQVQLNTIETLPKTANNDYLKGMANVNITITGITKQYFIPITSERKGEMFTFYGSKKLNIRDFGLTPPVEMMGIIRVNEWIDIDFNIICKISANKSTPEMTTINNVKY